MAYGVYSAPTVAPGASVVLPGNVNKNGVEIICNFDEHLLSIFAEVNHWEKLSHAESVSGNVVLLF